MLSTLRGYLAQIEIFGPRTPSSKTSGIAENVPIITIQSLPNELLMEIDSYLKPSYSWLSYTKRDLRAVCLTSKTLNAAAVPLLYHSISNKESSQLLRKLARTLSERPQLAKHVKYIDLRIPRMATGPKPSRLELIAMLEAILPLASRDSWCHRKLAYALRQGLCDANAALIVFLAKNVNNVSITMPGDDNRWVHSELEQHLFRFSAFMLSFALWAAESGVALSTDNAVRSHASSVPLTKVRTLYVSSILRDMPGLPNETFALPLAYMMLPSLTRITTQFSARSLLMPVNADVGLTNLRCITLDESAISLHALATMVRASRESVLLCVRWSESLASESHEDDAYLMDNRMLYSALQGHKQSLEYLTLLFKPDSPSAGNPRGVFGTLANFEALKSLFLDECFIFLADSGMNVCEWTPEIAFEQCATFLPASLRDFSLRTRKDCAEAPAVLQDIGRMIPQSLQSLDFIFASWSYDSDYQEALEAIPSLSVDCNELWSDGDSQVEVDVRKPEGVHAALQEMKHHAAFKRLLPGL